MTVLYANDKRLWRHATGTFENKLLVELFLPRLRADIAISKYYLYADKKPPPFCISAYSGKDDKLTQLKGLIGWQTYSTMSVKCFTFSGDPFFIHTVERSLLPQVTNEIEFVRKSLETL